MPLRLTSASFGAVPENGSESGSSMRSKAKAARTNTGVVPEDRGERRRLIAGREIDAAVMVEVTGGHGAGAASGGELDRRVEAAELCRTARQDTDVAAAVVGGHDVTRSVLIEVGG